MSEEKTLVIVEEHDASRIVFEGRAQELGYKAILCESPDSALAALDHLKESNPDAYANAILITDRYFPGPDGVPERPNDNSPTHGEALAETVKAKHQSIPILMWQDSATDTWLAEMRKHADHATQKPLDAKEMQQAIDSTLKNFEQRQQAASPDRGPGGDGPSKRIKHFAPGLGI